MKRSLISMIVATTLTTAAYAGDMDTDSTSNKWEKGACSGPFRSPISVQSDH